MDVAQKTATVLVVEDDVSLLDGIRNVLELEAYEVFTATDGLEALSIMKSLPEPPDLIVSDIMMPRLDGIELLKMVRQVEAWISIPFVYLTARGEKEDVQRGKRLGVDDYVIKPYDPLDLLITVQSRLERYNSIRRVHNERLYDLKDRILTILSHEFRTPLTMVVAYSDIIEELYTERVNDEELLTFLKGVGSGANRLRHLIENFIALIELETGETASRRHLLKSTIAGAALARMIQAVCDDAGKRFHRISCTVEAPDHLPSLIGYEADIRMAIYQLVDNAFKFSQPGQHVRVDISVDDRDLHIAIVDEGRGITPEQIPHIWESFYQIDREIHEDQGAGCGLAIARGIIAVHDGHITVDSIPGQGSIFTIHLPV